MTDIEDDLDVEARLASPAARPFWFVLGWLMMGLAAAGAVLPLLPTVPFVLVAAWAFGKSSKRWRAWIYRQPTFGPMLRNWERHGVIPPVGKYAAVLAMISSFAVLAVVVKAPIYVLALVGLILGAVGWFIMSRPSQPPIETPVTPRQLENTP